MHPTIIDRFAGPGGWSQAVAALGQHEVGIELDDAAIATARAAGHHRAKADVAVLDPVEFADTFCPDGVEGGIDSPPCPGFSAAGLGLGKLDLIMLLASIEFIGQGRNVDNELAYVRTVQHDPRSALTLEPLRWALALEPTWLAWEQVPAVLPLWEACATVLRARGWNVWVGLVQAEQYGVPQTRKRAILRAHRTREVGIPTPTHSRYYSRDRTKLDPGVAKWVSMAEALGWGMTQRPYVTIATGTEAGGTDPAGLGGSQARATVRGEMDAGRWTGLDGYGRDPSTWRPTAANEGTTDEDMAWASERPSPTIVGSFAPDVVARPAYRKAGDGPRQAAKGSIRITLAEAAALQSFPPDYPWSGGPKDAAGRKWRQVGDAVPPLLAEAILRDLL